MAIDTIHEESNTSEIAISSHEETPQEHREGSKPPSSKRPPRRHDSSELESGKIHCHRHRDHHHHHDRPKDGDLGVILQLALQSIGVVYGDIGTSPLYVYSSTFSDGIRHNDDILGVLSLIFYTLTLIPLIKYVFIVLRATDNGDGGTFALYSLVCRHAKVSLIPDQGSDKDRGVSSFEVGIPNNRKRRSSKLESRLEKSNVAKYSMLLATMLGTSMVIGDGVLTPCISVLSAVGGIKEATSTMTEDKIVWVSVAILVFLFMIQRFGTDKVGYSFAPIIFVWFCFIAGTGIFNFIKYDPYVLKALNPQYIVNYFTRNKEKAWISLGGVVLCTTGAEALFADVGHFSVRSIQISMCTVTYPALVLAYVGQASFLRKNEHLAQDAFYKSIPGPMFWPMFVVAVLASIIASQAMISGTFSIIQQSLSLGCFPRVKVVHTSTKYQGQVYIPEINFLLMLASLAVTLGFRTTERIGNAYGIAVVFVMTLTSAFLVLIMILIWETHILIVISYILVIVTVELVYLSSVLYKFGQGGYLPLGFALFLMAIMYIWHHVHRKTCYFELNNKISPENIKDIVAATAPQRLPGLAVFYSELVRGIPPVFRHYAMNVPALHSVLIFVSIESLPISKVPVRERFLVRRVESRDLRVFRCVVRYGYTDACDEHEPFENLLVERVREFIGEEYRDESSEDDRFCGEGNGEERKNAVRMEVEDFDRARRCGVVHLVGEHEVVAERGANIGKRIVINYAYSFLKRNFRQSNEVFDIPGKRMLKVGMIYEL